MTHDDHIRLIREGITPSHRVWADFGSGDGAFTLALREVIGPKADLYSIDTNFNRLEVQKSKFIKMYPNSVVHFLNLDFKDELPLPPVDGILMANSLHYIYDKVPFLIFIQRYLKPRGKLLVVEYNTTQRNIWVPFPIPFEELKRVSREAGFKELQFLAREPSDFLKEIYSAVTQL